jgi:peptide subunit release factor 1 (eRF1)
MFNQTQIRQLAEMSGPERAFATLYIGAGTRFSAFHKRINDIRSILAENPAEAEYFEDLKLIEEYLDKHEPGEHGMCVVACWALDVLTGTPLQVATQELLRVGSSPYIRPMAEFQDEYENFAVVMADNTDAHVFLVSSAVVHDEASVDGHVKNHVRKGGWSQKRYQRRRDNQLMHYAKEIDQELMALNQSFEFRRLLLVGSEETLNEIKSSLTPVLAEKIAGIKALDLGRSDDELWEEIYRLNFAGERASEQELWEKVREEYLSGGLAVAGVADVIAAAQQGRIHRAIVTRDAKLNGKQCSNCEGFAVEATEQCQFCGSQELFSVDLVNKITTHVYNTSASIDFVDPIPELTRLGDVAALTRY